MSYYSVKAGFNQAEIDLVLLSPQPRSTGVQVARRTYAASGAVIEEGKYIELEWNSLGPITNWNSLLNQFGLGAALTAEVTVRVPDEHFAYLRYNGVAVRPDIGKEVVRTGYFVRNVKMLIRDLVYI